MTLGVLNCYSNGFDLREVILHGIVWQSQLVLCIWTFVPGIYKETMGKLSKLRNVRLLMGEFVRNFG